jgi:GH24 family phage-related lysozyme (muramidase)
LNENQQNALISYGFNVGVGNWSRTQPKLLKALNEERFAEAS